MIVPNCKSVIIGLMNGQLVVVVNFPGAFTTFVPEEADISFEDGVKCKDVQRKKKKDDDDDDEDDD